jgi:formylglycine-generating enzyme required for sulfatase activity
MPFDERSSVSERRPRLLARSLVFVPALGLGTIAACASIAGIGDLEIGNCKGAFECLDGESLDGGSSVPDTSTGDSDIAPPPPLSCPDAAGPTMVRVGSASNSFCIDSTEVTFGDYRRFLAEPGVDASTRVAECAWNKSLEPGSTGTDDMPVVSIDWCDAYEYCKWAGKRLCGKIVNGENPDSGLEDTEAADLDVNQWYIACTGGGQVRYPYGSLLREDACNVAVDGGVGKALPVKAKAACNGGYPGIYDLLGNVWEWVDLCRPHDAGGDAADAGPQKSECFLKGGSFAINPANLDCHVDGIGASRDYTAVDIGFRCCAP